MVQIGKLSLQQVKDEIAKIEPRKQGNTWTKEDKRLYNQLGRKKNQLERQVNKEKKKGLPEKRNFQEEFELGEGTKSIIRNYLNEDLEIKKLESELEKRKGQMEEFKRSYNEVVGKFDKITDGIIEEKTTFERRMKKLKSKIPEEDEDRMKEVDDITREGRKKFETIKTIGKQNIAKYSLKRRATRIERELRKKKKQEEENKEDSDGEMEIVAEGTA